MFIPIGTDRRLKHRPYVNVTLIVVNVTVSIWVWSQYGRIMLNSPVGPYMLLPWEPKLYQFFTYQFLHADWEHLLLNMLGLWVFGNSVEDRFGSIGYLAFYLAAGVMSAIGFALLEGEAILGASGAIAGVIGAYLALFPLTRVVVVIWMLIVFFWELPSTVLIGLYIVSDLLLQFTGAGGVAYLAHLSGYVFGFLVAVVLMTTRVLAREPYDMLALFERQRRRREMRSLTRGGVSPWAGQAAGAAASKRELSESQQRIMRMREAISRALAAGDAERALDTYERLLAEDPKQVMARPTQLAMANTAMSHERHGAAAHAYELMLEHYSDQHDIEQVQLLLGLIYARYLNRPDRARELLTQARKRLTQSSQRRLADDLLVEVDEGGD